MPDDSAERTVMTGQVRPHENGATVIRGDARCLPLADASVDLIVTSPPYFALRSYQDGGEHYDGQIGSEPTPQEFLEALWTCTREWMRVLKPTGSMWINLGDKYVADNRGSGGDAKRGQAKYAPAGPQGFVGRETARQKSLMGLPWRYALGCIDQLGLILRAEVVWAKPNGLPESVTDRVRRSHEQWFHFTLRPRYFAAVDEVREPHTGGSHVARVDKGVSPRNAKIAASGDHGLRRSNTDPALFDPRGKLPGSVWEIPSEPLNVPEDLGVDHFAAFPTEWPRRIIQGWSPSAICTACDEPRAPQVLRERAVSIGGATGTIWGRSGRHSNITGRQHSELSRHTITGYACACPEPTASTRPAVVLDPFGGTGTTALVASVLGRRGLSVDLSHDYSRLARWRTTDAGERARAMRVEKPPKQLDGQGDLFAEVAS